MLAKAGKAELLIHRDRTVHGLPHFKINHGKAGIYSLCLRVLNHHLCQTVTTCPRSHKIRRQLHAMRLRFIIHRWLNQLAV